MYGYYLIQAMDIIEKCAEAPQTLRKVKELDIVKITKWYCKHGYNLKVVAIHHLNGLNLQYLMINIFTVYAVRFCE